MWCTMTLFCLLSLEPSVMMALPDSSTSVSKEAVVVATRSPVVSESTEDSDNVFASESRRLSELLDFPDGPALDYDEIDGSRDTDTRDEEDVSSIDKTGSTQKDDVTKTPMLSSSHQTMV